MRQKFKRPGQPGLAIRCIKEGQNIPKASEGYSTHYHKSKINSDNAMAKKNDKETNNSTQSTIGKLKTKQHSPHQKLG